MQTIIIDEEFKGILPSLNEEVYRQLEEELKQNGCRDALVVWNGTLIDGYNRYRICTEHEIPFNTVEKEFSSREEVIIWIITNQVARRNLTPIQLSHLRGRHYRADKILVTNAAGTNRYSDPKILVVCHNGKQLESTVKRLSDIYRVSARTISRDDKIAYAIDAIGEVSPDAKKKILSEEVRIDKKELERLSSKPREEIEAVAMTMEDGTFKRRETIPPAQSNNKKPADPVPVNPGQSIVPIMPADPIPVENRHLETAAINISSGYNTVMQKLYNDTAELKTALRTYIETLEEVFKQL